MPPLKARNLLKSKRPIVFPNDGFIRQLGFYAKKLGVLDESNSVRPSSKMSVTLPRFFGATKQAEESKVSDLLQSAMHVTSMKTNGFFETKSKMSTLINNATAAENEYHCKNCGIKMFNSLDIMHNAEKKAESTW